MANPDGNKLLTGAPTQGQLINEKLNSINELLDRLPHESTIYEQVLKFLQTMHADVSPEKVPAKLNVQFDNLINAMTNLINSGNVLGYEVGASTELNKDIKSLPTPEEFINFLNNPLRIRSEGENFILDISTTVSLRQSYSALYAKLLAAKNDNREMPNEEIENFITSLKDFMEEYISSFNKIFTELKVKIFKAHQSAKTFLSNAEETDSNLIQSLKYKRVDMASLQTWLQQTSRSNEASAVNDFIDLIDKMQITEHGVVIENEVVDIDSVINSLRAILNLELNKFDMWKGVVTSIQQILDTFEDNYKIIKKDLLGSVISITTTPNERILFEAIVNDKAAITKRIPLIAGKSFTDIKQGVSGLDTYLSAVEEKGKHLTNQANNYAKGLIAQIKKATNPVKNSMQTQQEIMNEIQIEIGHINEALQI